MADLVFRFFDHERHHESEQAESYEQEKIRAVSPFEKEHFSNVQDQPPRPTIRTRRRVLSLARGGQGGSDTTIAVAHPLKQAAKAIP